MQQHRLDPDKRPGFRWYWQSPRYEPTPFKLNELLTDQEALTPGVKIDARRLTNYNKTYKFTLDGKIGGQLKMLLDAELSGESGTNVDSRIQDAPIFSAKKKWYID